MRGAVGHLRGKPGHSHADGKAQSDRRGDDAYLTARNQNWRPRSHGSFLNSSMDDGWVNEHANRHKQAEEVHRTRSNNQ